MHILKVILEKFGVGVRKDENASNPSFVRVVKEKDGSCTLTILCLSSNLVQVSQIGTIILYDSSTLSSNRFVRSAIKQKQKKRVRIVVNTPKRGKKKHKCPSLDEAFGCYICNTRSA